MKRVEERIRAWNVVVQDTLETQTSFVAFGVRGKQPVVLKVMRQQGDEWRCGEVLEAFDTRGVVRVYEYTEGAVLMERLDPGTSLAAVALGGRDEEATEIIAEVIRRMSPGRESLRGFATVEEWGKGFQRYLASGDNQIPTRLVEEGERLYSDLCSTQQGLRLLHGDLQHYNILFDRERGWTAIDPKGVVGEIEYEIGASLRNPYEKPDLFASAKTVRRRLKQHERVLKLEIDRALEWGFAQAVLSAIWTFEDGFDVDGQHPSIMLANAIRPLM
ncbi:MAG TPA: aminoglycoside phosphotransferase family protein [Blastocatellia bacterium]|nr:aminoglycoside phosphotransferase family protein [Blastocatellia bacterium]